MLNMFQQPNVADLCVFGVPHSVARRGIIRCVSATYVLRLTVPRLRLQQTCSHED